MRKAAADWQVISYGGAVHGFTHPGAGKAVSLPGLAYDERTDRRSWGAMLAFFDEILPSRNQRGTGVRRFDG